MYEGFFREVGGGILDGLILPTVGQMAFNRLCLGTSTALWSAVGVSASGSANRDAAAFFVSLAVFPQVDEVVEEAEGFYLSHVFAEAAPAKTPFAYISNMRDSAGGHYICSCRGSLGRPTLRPVLGVSPRDFSVASLRGRRSPRYA